MKKRKEKKKSELNAQSFTCILFRFNKVFYRFEFIKYIYIFWSLSSKNEKLKKKKFELKSKIYIYIYIIKLLQVGQWLDFFDSTHCPIQHNFQHFIIFYYSIIFPYQTYITYFSFLIIFSCLFLTTHVFCLLDFYTSYF